MGERLAVVLPAFNEAPGLETLIWRVVRALHGTDYRIIVVDDGSTDATAAIAASLADQAPVELIRHDVNSGYGAAIRTGLLHACRLADIVITMDADDSHDPALIPLMVHGVGCGSDVVIASRFVPGGREVGVPFHRRVLSHGARLVFSRVLGVDGVGDFTSGYRAYRADFIDEMMAVFGQDRLVEETGFTVGVELLVKSNRFGGRISEVPLVLRYDRKRSTSKLNVRRTLVDYARLLQRVPDTISSTSREERSHAQPRRDVIVATVATDVASIFAAFLLSYFGYRLSIDLGLVDRAYPGAARYAGLAALFASTTVLVFWRTGLYASRTSALQLRHLQQVARALTVSIGFFFAVLFFASGSHPSRLLVAGGLASSYFFVLAARRAMTSWVGARRLSRGRHNRALIVGAGDTGRLLMKKIMEAPRLGMEVVGFLADVGSPGGRIERRLSQIGGAHASVEILGTLEDFERVANDTGATDLFITDPGLDDAELSRIHQRAAELGIDVAVVPRFGTIRPDQLEVDDLGAIPVVRRHRDNVSPAYGHGKRLLDLALVAALSLPAMCLGLVTAALIRLDGPQVLFRQTRIGRGGRMFTIFKFRTMDASTASYAPSPRDENDPRLTRIGRLVRASGLDELPQLVNVLRGDMSLVGPRPEMPQVVAEYDAVERARLSVRPGITGLWQLSPDRAEAIHDNIEYDLYYLRYRSLSLDLLIMGETSLFVFRALGRTLVSAIEGLKRRVRHQDGMVAEARWSLSARRTARRGRPHEQNDRRLPQVFVAFDQRRRPDEPASWSRYLPAVAGLSNEHSVRLLLAERNTQRIRALASQEHAEAGGNLDFVAYQEQTSLASLAKSADVVVTDLPHVADLASQDGRPVLVIGDGEIQTRIASDGQASAAVFVERVKRLLDSPDDRLQMATGWKGHA